MTRPGVEKDRLQEARHPAVIFAGAICDHLVVLPALRALASLFPGRLSWLGFPGTSQFFYPDVYFQAIHENFMHLENGRTVLDANKAADTMADCDLILSLSTWHAPEIDRLLELMPQASSVGYCQSFNKAVELKPLRNMFETAFDIPLQINPGLKLEDFSGSPVLQAGYMKKAAQLRQDVPGSAKILVIHADTKPEKMWPRERFIETLDLFLDDNPDFMVWVVGCKNQAMKAGKHSARIRQYLNWPLGVALALVGEADLFLGVDSCMLHAADLFRVPGVGLFGPTLSEEWGFRFSPHRHVCGTRNMNDILPLQVRAALEQLLGRK